MNPICERIIVIEPLVNEAYCLTNAFRVIIYHEQNTTEVVEPFQIKSGVQIGVQAMTLCVTIIYAYLKKRNISVLLEIT